MQHETFTKGVITSLFSCTRFAKCFARFLLACLGRSGCGDGAIKIGSDQRIDANCLAPCACPVEGGKLHRASATAAGHRAPCQVGCRRAQARRGVVREPA